VVRVRVHTPHTNGSQVVSNKYRNSPHLKLIAIAEDEATGEFTAVIEFRDIDGHIRRIGQPKSSLRKINELREALEDAGADISTNEKKNIAAIGALSIASNAAKRWKYAASLGWYDGHRAFVMHDHIVGTPRGDALILPPHNRSGPQRFALSSNGRHKDWITSVAKPARYSSCTVLGICMALAAPLVDLLDFHSFGILLSGPSKAGKSTALVVAGSVIGFAREKELPNFRTTDTALGELPASFNDMLVPLNELGLLKGSATSRYERIRDWAYGFAEGRGTMYSKFVTHDNGNFDHKWRALGFGTGEETFDEISLAAGETRAMGEAVRWIDLRATQHDAADIFDRCPESIAPDDRINWARRQCKGLRRAVADNHGVAFKHFIKRVIKRRRKISALTQPLIDEFVSVAVNKTDEPAVHHLASCFGLIRAGGILGVRFGTLPYSEKFVDRCIMRCYRAARRSLRTEGELLRSGLSQLRAKLKSSNMLKAVGTKSRRADAFKTADGYINDSGGVPTATVRADRFKGWFDDPRQPALVLRWLHAKKALPTKPPLPIKSGNAIVWAESQPEWPDGCRPRSVVIGLSAGLLDLAEV
jgi:putative DNA primase/helicase